MKTTASSWQEDLARRAESRAARAARLVWPCAEYADSPVRFARDILDRELWDEQAEWVQACARPDAKVSVVSGNKTGKSLGLADVALWGWSTFDPVRVFLFAPKIEHIENIALWPEIRKLYMNSGRCKKCRAIEHEQCMHDAGTWRCRPVDTCAWCSPLGDPKLWNEDPTKGLRSPDARREILAYTARDVDALGGISGPKMIFIFDEAGGIKPHFWDAMKGNAAGGVTWVMAGNPLHTNGEQYDAHHTKKNLYTHVQEISSEDTPNVREGFKKIPGLATREWVDQRAEDWGRESTTFGVRVKGKYPKYEPGQLLRVDEVAASNARWPHARFEGRLQIGVDVAFTYDLAALAPRRGMKIDSITTLGGDDSPLDADTLAQHVAGMARDLRLPHERKPLVVYDAQGKAGKDFGDAIRAYADEIDIVPVYGNAKPKDARRYLMRRDELAHGLAAWVKRGGALPPDAKLEGEIGQTVARPVSKKDQRAQVPSNDDIRKILGRSPDRRNACELACADVADGDGLGSAAHSPARQETPQEPHGEASPTRQVRKPAAVTESAVAPEDYWGGADAGMRAAWGDSV